MKKLLQKIKWSDIRLVLLAGVLVFLYAFSNKRSEERKIDSIDVNFKGEETHFVRESDIRDAIEMSLPRSGGLNRTDLDLHKMEDIVLNNGLIKNADVFMSIDGKLKVNVWQKKAIGRVVSDSESYYIDETGNEMPLSANFAERVPVVLGNVKKEKLVEFKELLDSINKDTFLREDIAGITIQSNGSIVLLSRLNRYDIIFGGLDEIQKKLENYKSFVQYSIDDNVDVDSYKTINLRFTQQVVCTK